MSVWVEICTTPVPKLMYPHRLVDLLQELGATLSVWEEMTMMLALELISSHHLVALWRKLGTTWSVPEQMTTRLALFVKRLFAKVKVRSLLCHVVKI